MDSDTPLLDILAIHLPEAISLTELTRTPQSRSTLETLLAFALGAGCPAHLPDVRRNWYSSQPSALRAFQDELGPKTTKRARESHDIDVNPNPKRQKTTPTDDDTDDLPRFTLPSISTTSPVRKKVNVTVHTRSIRFVNPSTRTLEASVPLANITRAFLLPTRGKPKGHWTVVLLPTDIPDKAKTSPSAAQQIIFGLDALSAASFETTTYSASGTATPQTATVAKGAETASALRAFLSHIPVPLLEPSSNVFRSACATPKAGHGAAGIDAYLAAKSGTLWFLDAGILWGESKPCEFWPVGDLIPKDGVRLISATGRTCSVILSRKAKEDGQGADDGVIETAFSMVDGKEQDPIGAWTRHRKHLFGKNVAGGPTVSSNQTAGSSKAARLTQVATNGTATVKGAAWDDSDPDDDDFEASSEDLEHSSSDSDDEGEGEGGSGVGSGDSDAVEESGEGSDEEIEELDPARHPLLRPGAMPRMSRATIDAVVDMVNRDLVDDASEEEDELEE